MELELQHLVRYTIAQKSMRIEQTSLQTGHRVDEWRLRSHFLGFLQQRAKQTATVQQQIVHKRALNTFLLANFTPYLGSKPKGC